MFAPSNSKIFADLVLKATSEALLLEDIALNLQVCDFLRGKKIQASQAVRILKDRLANKNPNVQVLTLKLTEMCVKNCGPSVHAEVCGKAFVDTLVGMIRFNAPTNPEVKNKVLELIQGWATVFRGKPELNYICEAYGLLKNEGVSFPSIRAEVTEISLDATTAPDWSDSINCTRCHLPFTTFRRKHHCRNCGQTFCNPCCSKKMALPELGLEEEERVCDGCYDSKNSKSGSQSNYTPLNNPLNISYGSNNGQASNYGAKNNYANDEFGDDLERALALSLQENKTPAPKVQYYPPSKPTEEDDPALAAAIAASLNDVTINKKSSYSPPTSFSSPPSRSVTNGYSSYSSYSSTSASSPTLLTSNNVHNATNSKKNNRTTAGSSEELSETEKSSITLFSKLIYKIEQNGDNIISNREIQELYGEMCNLHPKLLRNLEDVDEKLRLYMELNEKITKIIEMYNRIIEERMASLSCRNDIPPSTYSTGYPPPQPVPGYMAPPVQGYQPLPKTYPNTMMPPQNPNSPPSMMASPPPQFVPPQNQFGAPLQTQNQFPPPHQNQFGPPPLQSQNQFGNAQNQFAPPPQQQQTQNQFPPPPQNQFGPPPPQTQNQFGTPQNQFAPNSYPLPTQNPYPPTQNQYPPTQNQYPPTQNQYASPSNLIDLSDL